MSASNEGAERVAIAITATAAVAGSVLLGAFVMSFFGAEASSALFRIALGALFFVPIARNVAVLLTHRDRIARVLAALLSIVLLAIYAVALLR